ncbi:YciI family protein [Candidatus Poriferisodalis sp.]|uniref:YciI family protein n=1 Tax=Candidatus Poriferisodalis sp. TaxID=3101277 RepID=UPI003B019EC9
MRVMVMIKASAASEAGVMPDTELLEAMGNFNEELVDAGVMVSGEGLLPSASGKRIAFDGEQRTVIDGPFEHTSELVAGFWIWEVADMDEAVAWMQRCPSPMPGTSEVELRPIFEMDDFGDAMTDELRDQETRLRDQLADG